MSLEQNITTALKEAMKAKDKEALDALRAIKSALLLAKTETKDKAITELDEIKLLQKLVKQRQESATIFRAQNREDLAMPEESQAALIQQFLPEPLDENAVAQEVEAIITKLGANSMKDMGKVMGMANAKMAGRVDGKTLSAIIKNKLGSA
ncbi:MAG: GatB/YqeY domain-containing protein [Flavobacteriaceae bacterium]|jgi:hypothetical protein